MTVDVVTRYEDSLNAARSAVGEKQAEIWTALPGIIMSFDPVAITAQVKPAIAVLVSGPNQTKKWTALPVLPDVPVVTPRGGRYAATFPITAGDECVVVFSARCIDTWWQRGGVQMQRELRMHDLSDGLCFVGPWSQATKMANWSTTTAQLRNVDGTVFVEVDDTNQLTRLFTPGANIVVDGRNDLITVTGGAVSAVLDGKNNLITLTAATVKVNGDLAVSGEVTRGVGTGATVRLGSHEHGTGTPTAAGTVPPTPGT